MKRQFGVHLCLLGGLLLTYAATNATADEWNKKTYITTPRPIEVPGAVLPPGRYVFKLLDSPSNRHIVQILNDREDHVYTTTLTIAKQRTEPADKTVLTFYEMPGGGPEPIRAWFYPGDTIGQEFAYPKRRALQISRTLRVKVPVLAESHTSDAAATTPVETRASTTGAPNTASYDNTADRSVAAGTTRAEASTEANAAIPNYDVQDAPPATTRAPQPAMPHTAGNTASIALLGLGSLLIAASLRMASRAVGSRS